MIQYLAEAYCMIGNYNEAMAYIEDSEQLEEAKTNEEIETKLTV